MLLKFNTNGQADPFEYVMGLKTSTGKQRSILPTVLRGSIDHFHFALRTNRRRQKMTLPVLSYHAADQPSPPEVLLDIDLLNRVAFPGFREEDHEEVFVLHRQKQQLLECVRWDVHGIWLRQHMGTGLAYNPYYHRSDVYRFDLLKQVINLARGYSEPASKEHSRSFGFTLEGTKVHALETIVNQICEEGIISSLKQIAGELERRGYKIKKRRSGEPSGRKSLTILTDESTFIKLRGTPITPVREPSFPDDRKPRLERLAAMLAELNDLCFKRARRNWLRYQSKIEALSFAEAEQKGFGFEPITLQQLFPTNNYEISTKRTRLPPHSDARSYALGKSTNSEIAVRSASKDDDHGDNSIQSQRPSDTRPVAGMAAIIGLTGAAAEHLRKRNVRRSKEALKSLTQGRRR